MKKNNIINRMSQNNLKLIYFIIIYCEIKSIRTTKISKYYTATQRKEIKLREEANGAIYKSQEQKMMTFLGYYIVNKILPIEYIFFPKHICRHTIFR